MKEKDGGLIIMGGYLVIKDGEEVYVHCKDCYYYRPGDADEGNGKLYCHYSGIEITDILDDNVCDAFMEQD